MPRASYRPPYRSHGSSLRILATCALASSIPAPALPECREAALATPAARAIVAEARPLLTWQAVPGADRYRVQLESRVPEGRVLVSLDTLVSGTSFTPPRPLTDHRASVKVRVSSGCTGDGIGALREKPAWFQIDTSPLCPAPARIDVSADGRSLEWAAVTGALRYDVTLLDPEGRLRGQGETRAPRFALPERTAPLVAVVRPYCATGFGARISRLVEP